MSTLNFGSDHRLERALLYEEGTATRYGPVIDCRGYEGVAFILTFGPTIYNGEGMVKVQGGGLEDGSDMVDLAATGRSYYDHDANAIISIDIGDPRSRYLRLAVEKDGVNTSDESAVAALYKGRNQPVDQSSWASVKRVHAPYAGTP